MTKEKVVGLYTRVSTADKQNIRLQEDELKQFAANRGWKIYKVYSDRGQSGAVEKRPALEELWADCRKRRVDIVCVWALDRLARSLKQLIQSLDEFRVLGIDFVSYKQDFDTTSSSGRLLFHVVGAVAEFERDLIRERVIAGMAQARREGKRIGRPTSRKFSTSEIETIQSTWKKEQPSVRSLAVRFNCTHYSMSKLLGVQSGSI